MFGCFYFGDVLFGFCFVFVGFGGVDFDECCVDFGGYFVGVVVDVDCSVCFDEFLDVVLVFE